LFGEILNRFARSDSGVTAIEYGIIAAGIAIVLIAVISSLGIELRDVFQTVADSLDITGGGRGEGEGGGRGSGEGGAGL
jgi:pilus assembly protein Flp/PilA